MVGLMATQRGHGGRERARERERERGQDMDLCFYWSRGWGA